MVRSVYEGTFRRIMQTHHLDYFWLWTWEVWSWHGVSERQIRAIEDDIVLAYEAAARVEAPFQLALGSLRQPAVGILLQAVADASSQKIGNGEK